MAEFWTTMETNTAIRVPKYLKNILMLNGYDDALSIQSITTKDIDLFEEFVKNEIDNFIGVNDDPKDFYHIFWDKKDKFQIMKGDRVKLMDVVEFVRKKLASEGGHHFFKQAEETVQQTSGNPLTSQNYKQNYENQRLDVKHNIKTNLKVEVLKEVKGEIEMVTEQLPTTKHEQLHIQPQTDLNPLQTLSTSSTEDPLTVLSSPPPNAVQLSSLTYVTNRVLAERTSNIDVTAISLSGINIAQGQDVGDQNESIMQKGESTSDSAQLQNIRFGQNQHTNSGENSYACDVCQKVFGYRGHLNRHQRIHSGEKPYVCDVCQRAFGNISSLKRHQAIHSGKKPYVCDVCQRAFGNISSLKRHQAIHSGKKPYVCDVCQRVFGEIASLRKHQVIHSGQKPYVCDVCQQGFRLGSHLKAHQNIHSGQKAYVCDVCHLAFRHSSSLSTHKRIHTGQKPYACDVCQLAFRHSSTLSTHKRMHTGQKEYVCDVCQRAFTQLSNLKRHQTIHSGKKPYDVCQQELSQLSTLQRHQEIRNDDKELFSCAHCGKSYNRKFNLKIHLVECFKKHNFQDRFENH